MRDRPRGVPPPRFVPHRPFPPYAYITRRAPHPRRDPDGHSFGEPEPAVPRLDPQRWFESEAYLAGIDLFNHGYYWEAHEAWEGLWNACGRSGAQAEFVQGLIKLAAAGFKVRQGRVDGVRRHARAASRLLRATAGVAGSRYAGLDLDALVEFADAMAASPPSGPLADGPEPAVVFELQLIPTR